MNITVPFGTRPEIVKLAPVIARLRKEDWRLRLVFTGQHHDPALGESFLTDFAVAPDVRWSLPETPERRLGALLEQAVAEVTNERPDLVLLLGDTYTVPIFCLAARQAGVPVAHLEAGLRSFNETSIEEVNRRIAAATASLHLAPTDLAAKFLRAEGIPSQRIHVVGNPVIDIMVASGAKRCPPEQRQGLLITAHRATNVDDPLRLAALVDTISSATRIAGSAIFPVHPRTLQHLQETGLDKDLRSVGVELVAPQPYHVMLELIARARVVVTDSGGLQEEASWLGVPAVVLRSSTPRWEGVTLGSAELVGLNPDLAAKAVQRFNVLDEQHRVAAIPCPYGTGDSAQRVLDVLKDPATKPLISLTEPNFIGKEPPR
jgi:UDP-N-acetylglucosamine 2-epimerase (non-hydrolysing)